MKKLAFTILISIILISAMFLSACGNINNSEAPNNNLPDQGDQNVSNSNAVEVDIFEYIEVYYGGCNDYGFFRSATQVEYGPEVNTLAYLKNIFGSQYNIPGTLSDGSLFSLFEIVEKSERTDLSNGDPVVLSVTVHPSLAEVGETLESVMKSLNIRLTKLEKTHTVSGLEDAIIIDMYDILRNYFKVSYGDGCGELTYPLPDDFVYEREGLYVVKSDFYNNVFDLIYNNKNIARITLTVENNGKLSSGMNVDIKSYVDIISKECDKNYYVVPLAQYTVPALGTYLTSKDDLTEQNIEEIIEYAEYLSQNKYGEGKYKIEGIYFGKIKPQSTLYFDYERSSVVVIVSYTNLWRNKVADLTFNDIDFFKNQDGSLSFPPDPWGHLFDSHSSDDPNKLSELSDSYTYEKIK